jgi:hypothetical protein
MPAIAIPILPDQVDAWKSWARELGSSKRAEFEDLNTRMGLTAHRAWYFQGPAGPTAVVFHEGPGAESFLAEVASSTHPFDRWFRDSIGTYHGMDFSQPMSGPAPEKVIDWAAP